MYVFINEYIVYHSIHINQLIAKINIPANDLLCRSSPFTTPYHLLTIPPPSYNPR